ncbi:assimilatory sulfite reductase (NADPH) flavoprotein subunit [Lysobacter sp. TY2-98]|uniref:assimilatory sulfite reductase (NADPH) flavoprotein subunit n=1 Tax=Lysobacter sp. TY2-98 TaxID=2290922 RepID=UPI000E20305C|nr:assimilatory sulfite reductase (NADPH) flavoprotein subunit [Lysobacter sp. TY2-98]AXK71414.1 assimilatory sulfite reductase (NADPH) flavoprotein subunit [Lysobacter sp. TY2-98]
MSAVPLPAPLPDGRVDLLDRLTDGLGRDALWWLSGYAAALARAQDAGVARLPQAAAAAAAAPPLTVVYGSQTGNARRTAERVAARLGEVGLDVRLLNAADYPLRELKTEALLVVVISTQGDGDPPDDSRAFVDHLLGSRAPRLEHLRFGVLGLGDSSYPQFCAIGRVLDARLEALGARRWIARGDADLDIDDVATPWLDAAHAAARELAPMPALATVTPIRANASPAVHRDAPFAAPVLAVQRITGRGALRDVRHVELSLEGSGLTYEPGDALGVWPVNPPALVDEIIETLSLDGDVAVEAKGRTLPLRDWLLREREVTRLSRPVVARHAERARSPELDALLQDGRERDLARLLDSTQLVDLLHAHRGAWSAADLVAALRPLTPRLYSIASSQLEVGDEAHLTVAHVEYAARDRTRWGAASHLLTSLQPGDTARAFVERNERFRLPKDGSRDVLMIGPGTGVAPFRGFVQHRIQTRATGRNWLVFGAPHARSEFLYQLEWQQALKRGGLHRLDVAFSRDQRDKVYVQHRLPEHGREVYAWLEGGAHLYICGAVAMSKDVHATLVDIVASHGGRSVEDAAGWLDALLAEGRYARDVY